MKTAIVETPPVLTPPLDKHEGITDPNFVRPTDDQLKALVNGGTEQTATTPAAENHSSLYQAANNKLLDLTSSASAKIQSRIAAFADRVKTPSHNTKRAAVISGALACFLAVSTTRLGGAGEAFADILPGAEDLGAGSGATRDIAESDTARTAASTPLPSTSTPTSSENLQAIIGQEAGADTSTPSDKLTVNFDGEEIDLSGKTEHNIDKLGKYQWDKERELWKGTVWYEVDDYARELGIREHMDEAEMRKAVDNALADLKIGGENATEQQRWDSATKMSDDFQGKLKINIFKDLLDEEARKHLEEAAKNTGLDVTDLPADKRKALEGTDGAVIPGDTNKPSASPSPSASASASPSPSASVSVSTSVSASPSASVSATPTAAPSPGASASASKSAAAIAPFPTTETRPDSEGSNPWVAPAAVLGGLGVISLGSYALYKKRRKGKNSTTVEDSTIIDGEVTDEPKPATQPPIPPTKKRWR